MHNANIDILVRGTLDALQLQDKDKHLAANMARFAFCKEDASLVEASERLLKLRQSN